MLGADYVTIMDGWDFYDKYYVSKNENNMFPCIKAYSVKCDSM